MTVKDLFSLKTLGLTKKPQSVLGVDIGSSSIKIVQLRKEKERAVLETYGEIALGPYAKADVGQAVKISEETVIAALKDVLKEANTTTKAAAVSIVLKSSFVTIIEMPVVGGKTPSEMIEIEARRYVPVPISEVEMDWWILPETTAGQEAVKSNAGVKGDSETKKTKLMKVLLVVIHKDVISKYQKIVSEVGLNVGTFEIESFSMIRTCIGAKTTPAAIIDFGASSTKVSIIDSGLMMGAHSIARGSQDLTIALSRSLGIDFSRAEEMKREIGLSDLPEHKEMVSVLEPVLDYVFSETGRIIKDYQRKNKRTISRVVLTGGGSLLKNAVDFAVKRLNVEVDLANPFSKVEHPAFLGEVLKEAGPAFSVALGLALRELE